MHVSGFQSHQGTQVLIQSSRSVNEVICQGIPDGRKLKEGDIVNLGKPANVAPRLLELKSFADVTAYFDGGSAHVSHLED